MKNEKLIKYLDGMGDVLKKMSKEIKEKNGFDGIDLDLLKKIGSELLFKGCALGFSQ